MNFLTTPAGNSGLWCIRLFMQSLDTTIVNTALPSMKARESPLHMHSGVIYPTVAVLLASGWLADKIGVRNIFFKPPASTLVRLSLRHA